MSNMPSSHQAPHFRHPESRLYLVRVNGRWSVLDYRSNSRKNIQVLACLGIWTEEHQIILANALGGRVDVLRAHGTRPRHLPEYRIRPYESMRFPVLLPGRKLEEARLLGGGQLQRL